MRSRMQTTKAAVCIVSCGFFAAASASADDTSTPQDWIDRMGNAVQVTNYAGTVVRVRDGRVDTFKVVHTVKDGVVREKVVIQDGNGLEIIRNGNEVHCILPDRESVLVEEWNNQSTLFSTLPSSDIRFGTEYDLRIVREERVAGRRAVMLAVQPHDEYRFGHRIWLDYATGLPLAAKLIDESGKPLEQVKFADISLDEEIHASALEPSFDTAGFRWYSEPRRSASRRVDTDWGGVSLPPGYRVLSTHEEQLPGSEATVTHVLVSDGLANVSVFIEPDTAPASTERSREGTTSTYSLTTGEYRVTAVGEVPAATVEQVSRSLQPR